MKDKFALRHDTKTKDYILTFTPFSESNTKEKVIASRFRNFLRNHISASQYYALLRELTQDLEITQTGDRIIVKGDYQ